MSAITKRQILERLVAIGTIGGGARSPMICSDLINQDQLYDVQEKLQALMEDIANDAEVPDGPKLLNKAFPYIFKPKKRNDLLGLKPRSFRLTTMNEEIHDLIGDSGED